MKAAVYHGPGRIEWEDAPNPRIVEDTDAIIGVDTTTICGTDLHILKGDVPTVAEGRILGHEAVGTIEAVGAAVSTLNPGDRVLVSCVSACGRCRYCRERRYGQCVGGGGWILGHTIDGTQADYVRVPFADTSTHLVPPAVSDESLVMFADIMPTAYEMGVVNGRVQPGDTVAIIGAGPVGLAAVLAARLLSPSHVVSIDVVDARLEVAKQFGADLTINASREDVTHRLATLTDGLGVDTAIEAVGTPDTFELCTRVIRPGGRVANVGVHGKPATLELERLWSRDVTITTGLVDTWSTDTLLRLVRAGQLQAQRFMTHHFALGDMLAAYDTFGRAGETGAVKVALQKESKGSGGT